MFLCSTCNFLAPLTSLIDTLIQWHIDSHAKKLSLGSNELVVTIMSGKHTAAINRLVDIFASLRQFIHTIKLQLPEEEED